MFMHLHAASRFTKSFQHIVRAVSAIFFVSSLWVPGTAAAQNLPSSNIRLPVPGVMVQASAEFTPALMRGLRVYPDNPLMFDFIIDQGEEDLTADELQSTSQRLIKYFLASLTIPEDRMWVNLSPYEQQRIISAELEITGMGRDLLSMDYLLKQLTASLMYPEDQLGKDFWERVKSEALRRYGSSDIPMNTFNKIWVVPADAQVFEIDGSAYVVESRLKVMLEEDYLALEHNSIRPAGMSAREEQVISGITSDVVRDVLIPEIEKEINSGRHFAKLRQIYDAMILATWYKQNLRESLLGRVYVDRAKMKGIDEIDEAMKERIYRQYLEAFKVGVYNYVKEDYDATLQMEVPRKFFSGGASMNVSQVFRAQTAVAELDLNQFARFLTLLDSGRLSDPSRQQVIARIQALEATDRARLQDLVRQRAIPDAGIARIVEVQISLLENAPAELETAADAAILNTPRPDVPVQTVTIANREMRPEDALGAIAEVRRMLFGAVPQIDVPTYPIPSQTRPKLLLAALEEGLGDNPISNRRWRNFESVMNEIGDALGIFVYSDFTGTDFAGSPVERTFQLDDVGGKITDPAAVGTAFYTELPADPQEVTALIRRINAQLDYLEAEARPVLDENIAQLIGPQTEGQVVILANSGFDTDARAVGRFLTAGRSNVLGLMGPANLSALSFTDPDRPKAIGFSRAELEQAGITVPEDGVIDSDFLTTAQLQPLQAAIRQWTDQKAEGDATIRAARLFGEILTNLDPDVNPASPVQVRLSEATQNLMLPVSGFTEPADVQAVFPILDIRIRDALGNERTIRMHRRSPVLTDEVEVLGIGPETQRAWRSIINNAAGVIVVGDTTGLEDIFAEAPAGQPLIQIASRDVNTLQELGRDMYWRDLSDRVPTGSSINELAALSDAREQLATTDERYQVFDPRGELAANGIQIFIVEDLLEGTRRIADEQGVPLGTDMLMHPGVVGNALFFSPQALNIIAQQTPEYRAALARHHLVHIQRPELSESQVNAIAALPSVNDPAFARPGTPRLARFAATPQEYLNAAAERLVSELGVGIITRNILSPEVEAYEAVDPLDILAGAGIRVYTVPNLMATALELAAEYGVDLPADAVIQPGFYNGNLYVDTNAVDILYGQSEEYRTALARHYLLQWQFKDVPELEVADIERIAPRPQLDDPEYGPAPFRNVEAQSETLPQLRQGISVPEEDLINAAVLDLRREMGSVEFLSAQEQIEPGTDRYRRLDPDNVLAEAGIPIFVLPGLRDRTNVLAAEQGIDAGLEVIMHPGVLDGALYFDPAALGAILRQGRDYRAGLARHQLLHLEQPGLTESQIEEQAPLPAMVIPAGNQRRRTMLARIQEKLSTYGTDGVRYLQEIATQSRLFPLRSEGADTNFVLMASEELESPEQLNRRRQFVQEVFIETIEEVDPNLAQYLELGTGSVTLRRTGQRLRALSLNFKNQPEMLRKVRNYFYKKFKLSEAQAVDGVFQRVFDIDMFRTMQRLSRDVQYAVGAMYSLQQLIPSFARRFPVRPIQQGVALAGPESTFLTPYILVEPEAEGESPLVAFVSGRQVIIRSGRIARTGSGLLSLSRQDTIIFDDDPKIDIRQPLGADLRIDAAVLAQIDTALQPDVPVGGIDLNAALLDLQIKRDGAGIPLPLTQQPVQQMNISGFTPIIIKITPLTQAPALLNL